MAPSRLHKSLRGGMAVFFQQILLQGAGVDTDADRNIAFLRCFHHSAHLLLAADIAGV